MKQFLISTLSTKNSLFRFATLLLLILGMVIITQKAYSAQVILTWDQVTDPAVTGYKIYYGPTSGNYTQSIDVGNMTTYTINTLASGSTYYIAAKDHDASGIESGFSNEVIAVIPAVQTTYTITATSDSNGAIIPSGNPPVSQGSNGSSIIKTVTVTQGANQSFTMGPNVNYHLADLKADGASVGAVSMYTFSNVAADHTLNATFAFNNYSITASAGTGGSISPAGTSSVTKGVNKTFTITPGAGYYIAGVSVDGVSVGVISSYTFSNVTASHTIAATFAINTYTIAATAGSGGKITPSGSSSVKYGGSKTYTIAPATGYSIANVKVDGVSVGTVSEYTFSNVTASHNISATYKKGRF